MNASNIEKLRRLIYFREKQRDIAAADMEAARMQEEAAKEAQRVAEQVLQQELQAFRDTVGAEVNPLDLELAIQNAKWAQIDVNKKENDVQKQQQLTEEQRLKLLESHKKVKQMETLHQQRKSEIEKQRAHLQQSELDDLAVVKEVHK